MKKSCARRTQDHGNKTKDHTLSGDAPLCTPPDLKKAATRDITGTMNGNLADVFAL